MVKVTRDHSLRARNRRSFWRNMLADNEPDTDSPLRGHNAEAQGFHL